MELPDLYPAQVGSPYTTLAAPYATGEATMTVVDATKLPDAPNIVCLAGSVAGEFRYSGKDGNTLLGVVKLPGTPNATWPTGTFAFRGVSAYDHNALIEYAQMDRPKRGAYDAIVYKSGTSVIAEDATGATIASGTAGTDDSAVIQAAIDAFITGGHIVVGFGTYAITKHLKLQNAENVTITGCNNPTFVISSPATRGFYLYNCNNVGIYTISFTNATNNAIVMLKSSSIKIDSCTFDTCYGAVSVGPSAVADGGCNNIRISNNLISNYSYAGVIIGNGCRYIMVDGNTIHDGYNPTGPLLYAIATDGIEGKPEWGTIRADYVTITNNHIYNHTMHNAIDSHGGRHHVITNNILENVAGRAIYCHNCSAADPPVSPTEVDSWNWVISGNVINTAGYGIIITSDHEGSELSNVSICDNNVRNVSFDGIRVDSRETANIRNIIVSNNTIHGHTGEYLYAHGIGIKPSSVDSIAENVVVSNNTISTQGDTVPFEVGIEFRMTQNGIVSGNVMCGCGIVARDRSGTGASKICDNVIYGNPVEPPYAGIQVFNTYSEADASRVICGNTIEHFVHGVYISCESSTSGVITTDNLINSCTTPIYVSAPMGAIPKISNNTGYVTENSGSAPTVADGGTIAHGCVKAPTKVTLTGSVAGEIVTVTSIDATNITVAIKKPDGSAGTTQTIYWRAEV
jgi:hypothetical protein